MNSLLGDIRYGTRVLLKRPGLSALAIVALAVGIGLTTTMFSIVYAAVIKGLPYEQSERLVAIFRNRPAQGIQFMQVSIHDFVDWREQQNSFEALAAQHPLREPFRVQLNRGTADPVLRGLRQREPVRHPAGSPDTRPSIPARRGQGVGATRHHPQLPGVAGSVPRRPGDRWPPCARQCRDGDDRRRHAGEIRLPRATRRVASAADRSAGVSPRLGSCAREHAAQCGRAAQGRRIVRGCPDGDVADREANRRGASRIERGDRRNAAPPERRVDRPAGARDAADDARVGLWRAVDRLRQRCQPAPRANGAAHPGDRDQNGARRGTRADDFAAACRNARTGRGWRRSGSPRRESRHRLLRCLHRESGSPALAHRTLRPGRGAVRSRADAARRDACRHASGAAGVEERRQRDSQRRNARIVWAARRPDQ